MAKSRSVSVHDVARAAGVSIATVSRVVRNHADVRETTRERVRQVIGELGYRPSPLARALVSGRSQMIALLISDIVNPFYPQLARGVEREAAKAGYGLIICNTEDRPEETRSYVERLLDQGVEGFIHASVGLDEEEMLAPRIGEAAVIFVNRRPRSASASYVVSDNRGGARLVTKHLLEAGHRRIGFVGGPEFATNAVERLEGFLKTMTDHGANPLVAPGDFSLQSGRAAGLSWIESAEPPMAVIGVSDMVALGVMEAVVEAGLRIPADVAVAGFDATELGSSRLIGLTSVSQQIDRMAERGVRGLLRLLEGGSQTRPIREVLPASLATRSSTDHQM